ncbi:MAG: FtsW/RodA/SpoVE family cell cycle protein, partial [Oscillospiraceae bacterium]|nr:FtsW/RodA/SpoVE family cell cycle protein [Oscillospiraceae bacterium]
MDLPFVMLVLLLTGIGVVMVFSASYASAMYDSKVAKNDPTYYFVRQALFGLAGVAVMYLVSKLNYQTFRWMSIFILIGSIVLLVLVLVPGLGVVRNNARRWIKLPLIPQFQPSEVAKLGVIMYFAARLCKRNTEKPKRINPRSLWSGPIT